MTCGPHNGPCDPKTLAERLDAAQDGREFARVINSLFGILEKAKNDD